MIPALLFLAAGCAPGSLPDDAVAVPPSMYGIELVSSAATGLAMNAAGDVVGTSYRDPGCGSACLAPLDAVVWHAGRRFVLPELPGFTGVHPVGINARGEVAGYAGVPGTATRAVRWTPGPGGYTISDLGTLPGTTSATAAGIDDLGRIVGWSTTIFFPPVAAPFVWTAGGGIEDLTAHGFPAEAPLAISPGGLVTTAGSWYDVDDPTTVQTLPPAPRGFLSPSGYGTAINDAGDIARLLVETGGQSLLYPFRLANGGAWEQLSLTGSGSLTPSGIGGINDAMDVTATVQGFGMIAAGPAGSLASLTARLSPAYAGAEVLSGGPLGDHGAILARVTLGPSPRLVRLVPAAPCVQGCARARVSLRAAFRQDPAAPGQCVPGGPARNDAQALVRAIDERGRPLAGVVVRGRFMDDYWMQTEVSGRTDATGAVVFRHTGPCGVGSLTFVVEGVRGRTLDQTEGVLYASVVP